jgi:hypothetical protein
MRKGACASAQQNGLIELKKRDALKRCLSFCAAEWSDRTEKTRCPEKVPELLRSRMVEGTFFTYIRTFFSGLCLVLCAVRRNILG